MKWGPYFANTTRKTWPLKNAAYAAPTQGPGSEHHEAIQSAIDNQHELELVYQGKKDLLEGTQRVLIPIEMGPATGAPGTSMYAFDLDAGIQKEFRTDRIVKILGARPRSVEPSTLPTLPTPSDSELPTPSEPKYLERAGKTPQALLLNPNKITPSYDIVNKSGEIEPTREEYDELRSLDVDPMTHDKATVRRLRNKGVSHAQLKQVAQEHAIPYEDYENALKTTDDHTQAIQEALTYRSNDREQITRNQERMRVRPDFGADRLLSDDDHKRAAGELFFHHLGLRNAAAFASDNDDSSPYRERPGRRRANEWILSELSKLQPALKKNIGRKDFDVAGYLQGDSLANLATGTENKNYFDRVNSLSRHHSVLLSRATDLAELTRQRRSLKALTHIGNARFYPYDYAPDLYEED